MRTRKEVQKTTVDVWDVESGQIVSGVGQVAWFSPDDMIWGSIPRPLRPGHTGILLKYNMKTIINTTRIKSCLVLREEEMRRRKKKMIMWMDDNEDEDFE